MTYKQAAKTIWVQSENKPKTLQQASNWARKRFEPFGAGSAANDFLREQYDYPMDDVDAQLENLEVMNYMDPTKPKPQNPRKAFQELDDLRARRDAIHQAKNEKIPELSPMVDRANRIGAGIGVTAGLIGGGLMYAGLGLIPKLKQKRLLRALFAVGYGLPIGYISANQSARFLFNRDLKKS